MIVHRFLPKKGLAILTPEDVDDLWALKRIITPGDIVSAETSRAIKATGMYVRPNRGERVKVTVILRVERVRLDNSLERLRISGKILDISGDVSAKGSFHSITITPNRGLSIRKENWGEMEVRILRDSEREVDRLVLVTIDRREAGVGVLQGTHLRTLATLESGLTGKRYGEKGGSLVPFYERLEQAVGSVHRPGSHIFITGPGPTKASFFAFLSKNRKDLAQNARVIEGIDVAGEDGVYMVLHSPQLRKLIEGFKLAKAIAILELVVKRISENDPRVSYAFDETREASKLGAVEVLLVSDKAFEQGINDDVLVSLLNTVEAFRGRAYLIDSSTEVGSQVSALGGIVALLRFPTK